MKSLSLSLNGFLGIDQLPSRACYYVKAFTLLSALISFVYMLSNTFYILYIVDRVGFTQAGFIVSIMFLIQLVTDYPSGSVGDWIGQRWILVISIVSYGMMFFLLPFAQFFTDFVIIGILHGFANGQNSGALSTWLDNNYKKTVGNADPDMAIYGFSRARALLPSRIGLAFTFIIGGIITTQYSREFVFFFQSGMAVIIVILILLIVKDEKPDEIIVKQDNNRSPKGDLIKHLSGGVKFCLSSKSICYFIIGTGLFYASVSIWGSLILLPVYYGYTGSDGLASILRTVVFILGFPLGYYVANVAKNVSKDKITYYQTFFVIPFFGGFVVLLTFIPIDHNFNIIGIVISVILLIQTNFTYQIAEILRSRVMIDLIPSKYRNAVYSLVPTIQSLFAVVLLPTAGIIIENNGIALGVVLALIFGVISSVLVFYGMYLMKNPAKQITSSTLTQGEDILALG